MPTPLEIKGFNKYSLIEYPGKISAVIFLPRCNFRCPFCQNPDLILNYKNLPSISGQEVINYLSLNKKWIDALSISGGEPTLCEDLSSFIKEVKERGFLIQLETNGTNPQMLKELLEKKLIDYVALDIKAPLNWEKYKKVSGISIKEKILFEKVKESIKILLNGEVNYEFRTTLVPVLLSQEDIINLAGQIKGAKKYVLQQFVSQKTLNKDYEKIAPYPKEKLEIIKERIKKYFQTCEIRGV